ncbi:universal stress protein [Streptomyces olivaceoviridis]|uniref:universal stress protein n=1 Tax=Streptomyces olivaceoviridis TaxID=1921 RepID=UPI0036F4D99F
MNRSVALVPRGPARPPATGLRHRGGPVACRGRGAGSATVFTGSSWQPGAKAVTVTGLPLVVGVDGSDSGLTAVDWAVDEAARHGLPLRLAHACLWEIHEGVQPSFTRDRTAERVMAEHIVASCVERARRRNSPVPLPALSEYGPPEQAAGDQRAGGNPLVRSTGPPPGPLLGSAFSCHLTAAVLSVRPIPVPRAACPGYRRTRGIPRPIQEMISRWISLLPPPKVKMTAER